MNICIKLATFFVWNEFATAYKNNWTNGRRLILWYFDDPLAKVMLIGQ